MMDVLAGEFPVHFAILQIPQYIGQRTLSVFIHHSYCVSGHVLIHFIIGISSIKLLPVVDYARVHKLDGLGRLVIYM